VDSKILYKGIIFCEILNEFIAKENKNSNFLTRVYNQDLIYNKCISNLNIALTEIKKNYVAPEYINVITADELFEVTN
jgi:hypothetical protein